MDSGRLLPSGKVVQIVRQSPGGSQPRPQPRVIHVVSSPAGTATVNRSATVISNSMTQQPQSFTPMGTAKTLAVTPLNITRTVGGIQRTYGSAPGAMGIMKRPIVDHDVGYGGSLRKYPRSTDKSKGLRHFSTKVCEKVKEKGRTTYNEVADELVTEYFEGMMHPPGDSEKQQYDMKNIRRRVYDALNVLMAMNIIEKEKKEIRWVGLPTSSVQECTRLEEEKHKRQERIKQKAEQLQELIIQLVAYKSLVSRNRTAERQDGRPALNTLLYLPYIVVNTDKKTMIDCSISHDKTEYLFNFDQPFEIHDDIEVLKRLGLARGLEKAEVAEGDVDKVKNCLPPALKDYVDQILEGRLAGGLIGPSVAPKPPVVVERAPRPVALRAYQSVSRPPPLRSYLSNTQSSTGHEYASSPSRTAVRYALVGSPARGQQGSQNYASPSFSVGGLPRRVSAPQQRQVAYIVGTNSRQQITGYNPQRFMDEDNWSDGDGED